MTKRQWTVLIALGMSGSAWAGQSWESSATIRGPATEQITLYRPYEGANRLFVEASLGDGQPRFFLLDTGAELSVLHQEVADELGLAVRDTGGRLLGVAGGVPWRSAFLQEVQLGRLRFGPVHVAVGVPGVPTRAGQVELAGIIGMDLLSQTSFLVDYAEGVLTIAEPGLLELPEDAVPLVSADPARPGFLVGAEITVGAGEDAATERVLAQVDTGATDLLLFGPGGKGWEDNASVGVEAILGIGNIDELPASNFLEETWRLPVASLAFGGQVQEREFEARWLPSRGKTGLWRPAKDEVKGHALVGHQSLEGHKVWFDFPGSRFAMEPVLEEGEDPAFHDLQRRALRLSRRGGLDLDPVDKAALLFGLDEDARGTRVLERAVRKHPEDAEATVFLARVRRFDGETDAAMALLAPLTPALLAEHHALVAQVNSLWLAGRFDEAEALAVRATEELPEEEQAWLALSDIRRAQGRLDDSRTALLKGNRVGENPDGHLLRRAWTAQRSGDDFAALAHLRRILDLYPMNGLSWWMYAEQAAGTEAEEQLRRDLERARGRLHASHEPLDYHAAAMQLLGDDSKAEALVARGLERDCAPMDPGPSAQNCTAWYSALARSDLAEAQELVEQALIPNPHRSDYLDTLALVHEVRGQDAEAGEQALEAARLRPDDVYLLWQVDRRGVYPGPAGRPDPTPRGDGNAGS